MKFIKNIFDKNKPQFEKGGKFEKLMPLFETFETLFFVPDHVTPSRGAQIRDAIDLKRMMMTVIIAMIPCLIFGIWNVGYQHGLATGEELGFGQQIWIGLVKVLPIIVVSYAAGLGVEFIFGIKNGHALNEGFLVSGMLIPLVMPPTIPLWQVALATIFAVLIGKEVFGGTGMNIVNVALTARAFLYFAYPSKISGDVWTYLGDSTAIDGYTGGTALAIANEASMAGNDVVNSLSSAGTAFVGGDFFSFSNMFFGFIPGSIGETSTLMALIGALILIYTGVGSWKIIVGVFGASYLTALMFNAIGANEFMQMPAHYHLVIGGLAFGAVFMATDPVTAAQTERGKWIYGILIGVLTIVIRVFNPAYPEGIMLAILLMNVFAPLIDFYVVKGNKQRRIQRATV
jgi:Na+-transporting NADH:ubiquinone oxidoreductase subunit B